MRKIYGSINFAAHDPHPDDQTFAHRMLIA